MLVSVYSFFFFSSRRRHTRLQGDWSSDVCSSDLDAAPLVRQGLRTALEVFGIDIAQRHDAHALQPGVALQVRPAAALRQAAAARARSEEHTSELQSPCNLVCRLLLEKKKQNKTGRNYPHTRRPRAAMRRTPEPPSGRRHTRARAPGHRRNA